MIVQAQLDRKPGGYPPPRCQVEKVVKLSAEEFDGFLKKPLQDKMFIAENKELMLHRDLGFTNAEIDALGFDLAHRFEAGPDMARPQL